MPGKAAWSFLDAGAVWTWRQPVSDISAWLQELGLGKYANAFVENEIDVESLPFLTENMLVQIGLPVGPRAKLLAAISELPSLRRHDNDGREEPATAGARPIKLRNERRQVTVMFCDLVDSTKLAGSVDPEDLGVIFEAYQTACKKVIERYEGHIAQYRGDGIEVIYGWPTAHEDAAERAVRSGLQLIESVKSIAIPQSLSARVGISTGIVVTGVGDPLSRANAVGEALHIAARLETIAAPGTVVVSETTSRLVSARFDQEDLGPQQLKGVEGFVRAFRVIRLKEDASRFQIAQGKTTTQLVGRGPELAFLQQRWREVEEGEGKAIFISGVPGVGKSRIVYELGKSIENEPHLAVTLQCLPYGMQSALSPVIECIERLGKLNDDDPNEAKLEKIERLLSLTTEQAPKVMPLIAELLSIPTGNRYPRLVLTPQQLKIQTLSLLVEFLLEYSSKCPIYCIIEDIHWIDPSTQELLDLLVGQIENGRILLVATHRPEYQISIGVRANVGGLTVARLGRRDLEKMVKVALGGTQISPAVMERVMDESDSIPLFVEELVRGVIGSGAITRSDLARDSWNRLPLWCRIYYVIYLWRVWTECRKRAVWRKSLP